uniref:IF rod domain-containing protein n=1 Tax=Leptobrachium leishanense TaxID=445787 RepID=A0A8C5QR89_9ANUR
MSYRIKQKNHCFIGSQFNQIPRNYYQNFSNHKVNNLGVNKGHQEASCPPNNSGSHKVVDVYFNQPHHGGFHTGYRGGSLQSPHGGFNKDSSVGFKQYPKKFQKSSKGFFSNSHHGGSQNSTYGGWNNGIHGGNQQLQREGQSQAYRDKLPQREYNMATFSKYQNHRGAASLGRSNSEQGLSFKNNGRNGSYKRNSFKVSNTKEDMKLLNERLLSYMEKVHTLAEANIQLERKIFEWYAESTPIAMPETKQHFMMIEEIQDQISTATIENSWIILQTKEHKQAIQELAIKYEKFVQSSENNNGKNMQKTLQVLNQDVGELNAEVEDLQQELQQTRRDNDTKVKALTAELGHKVSVEVKVAPSADLKNILFDIRKHYGTLMETNLKEAENVFRQRIDELNKGINSSSEDTGPSQAELINMKNSLQTLEIQLQWDDNMISTLENTLEETQDSYASQLAQLQKLINHHEGSLVQIRKKLDTKNQEYHLLRKQKDHLELDIATYQNLLDRNGADVGVATQDNSEHGKDDTVKTHKAEQLQ